MDENNIIEMPQADSVPNELKDTAEAISALGAAIESGETPPELTEAKEALKESLGLEIPEEIIAEIGALFALPDDYFGTIADAFIESFENSLNNPADKISLCQALNISNVKTEDLIAAQEQWNQTIDIELKRSLSAPKRQFLKRLFAIVVNVVMDSEGVSKRTIQVPIVIEEGATIPSYAHIGDAGLDVYAFEEVTLEPGETKIVKTGIKVQIPKGYELQVRPRSGLSVKSKLRIANAPGTIDSTYRDEIGIICENIDTRVRDVHIDYIDGKPVLLGVDYGAPITIEKGQRIAQLVLAEVPTVLFNQVDSLSSENDREGGFGSTGE